MIFVFVTACQIMGMTNKSFNLQFKKNIRKDKGNVRKIKCHKSTEPNLLN